MKKTLIVLLILCTVVLGQAQTRRLAKRPIVELGPKASLYLGSLRFGIGAELLVNPLRNFGLRFDLAELSFGEDDTRFSFNLRELSMDGIIYIPMQGIKPYAFLGLGLAANEDNTRFQFRGGLGFNYSVTRRTDIFVEPGAIITHYSSGDYSNTDIWFRLSVGGRFGIIR
jgi:hypothetical protein